EEEAVACRICMDELQEDAQGTLRGELALAHKECALKWFSIGGDITCEICNQGVMNLRVMHSPTFS
ncbi:zinc finger, RING-CH-type, zinc finger, RING/FYVE/PHD-type containing protein, partial [Tanacetum coccineum]